MPCLIFQAKEFGVYPNVVDEEPLKNFKPREFFLNRSGDTCRFDQRREKH